MRAFIKETETKSLIINKQFQVEKIVNLLSYVNSYSKFYQTRFKENKNDILNSEIFSYNKGISMMC
jgi:hypothetical protein